MTEDPEQRAISRWRPGSAKEKVETSYGFRGLKENASAWPQLPICFRVIPGSLDEGQAIATISGGERCCTTPSPVSLAGLATVAPTCGFNKRTW